MVNRSVAPTYYPPDKFTLPKPEIIHLRNGCHFFLLPSGDQPVIKLEFIFRAGLRFELNPGIAFFTAKLLTEGTENYNSREISEALDQFGAFIEIHPGFDFTNLSIHIPTEYLREIRNVLKEILFHPVFPNDELELLKQIQVQQLRVNNRKNRFVASRLFRAKLFPENPYGHVMDEKAIENISKNQAEEFYGKWIKGNFDIFLTGQFNNTTKDLIFDLIKDQLSPSHEFSRLKITSQGAFNEYLKKEDSLQSSIFMGKKCINRKHPSYPSLLLLNEVFGGYFGSRLMQNIREDKGFTYSIYSQISSLRDEAYFVIYSDVKKEFKDQAISEINKEVAWITNEPIGQAELAQAKNYLKGSILNAFTNSFAITEKIKNIYFYELGDDFYDRLFDEIDRIQAIELLDLAQNTLFNQPLSTVIVG